MLLTSLRSQRRSALMQSIVFISGLFCSLLAQSPVYAASTCTFNGPGTDWADVANWSCGAAPGVGGQYYGDVIIANGKTSNINGSNGTISIAGSLTINQGASVTVGFNNPAALYVDTLQNNGAISSTNSSGINAKWLTNAGTLNSVGYLGTANILTNNLGASIQLGLNGARISGSGLINNGTFDCGPAEVIFEGPWIQGNASSFLTSQAHGIQFNGPSLQVISGPFSIPVGYVQTNGNVNFQGSLTTKYLAVKSGSTVNLFGASVVTESLTIAANAALKLASFQTLTAPPFSNLGLIQQQGGSKIITQSTVSITDVAHTPIGQYTVPGSAYITIYDSNRNLDGTIPESISVQVRGADAIGADLETQIALQSQSSPDQGVFYIAALPIIVSANPISENGTMEVSGSGTMTVTYTDPQDANDQKTASVFLSVPNQADVTPPTVSFASPTNGATVSGSISIGAAATDNVGVTGYVFKVDGTVLTSGSGSGSGSGSNTRTWNTAAVSNGTHTLTVTASDAANNQATATITVSVNNQQVQADVTPPTVSFPASMNTNVSGASVPFSAAASDNVGVTKVEFRIDGNLIDTVMTSPFDTIWDASGATNIGTHTLTAKAYDAANNSAMTSVQITVTAQGQVVDTVKPVVSFITPSNGATVSGSTVTVSAVGTDNSGTPLLVFKADNIVLPMNAVMPDTVIWDTTPYTNGNHQLSVTATDAANNSTTAIINVIVQNGTNDSEKPIISLTSPLDGATVSSVVTLEATASDNVGVEGVMFKVDGIPVGNEVKLSGSSFSTTWNSASFSNADHIITAVARDAANNSKSTSITVTVLNAVQENNVPNVDTSVPKISITKPTNGAAVSGSAVSLLATVTDNVGVVGVFFDIDQIPLGSEISTQPYSKIWDSTSVSNGEHTFTVTAYDLGNNVATASVKFNVANQEQTKAPVFPVYTGSNVYTQPQQAQYTLSQFQALQVSGGAVHKLIKLPDDGNPTTQEDTAVYYIGADGKRHAFTNSKVFFTWYCGFDDVITITPEAMATLPLGKNITYHPGVRMVKFISNPQVYAVTGSGMLRPITTEAVATALYGATWNKAIDDIADAFYTDYTINPTAITSASYYNVASTIQTSLYPSDVMNVPGYTPTAGLHPFVCAAPVAPPVANQDDALDTDNDGIKNGEELNVYGTDPSKKDTDNDGFTDYQEIMNGYNPLGAGKCTTNKCIVK